MKKQKGQQHFFMKAMGITIVCLFTFTTIAWSTPSCGSVTVQSSLQKVTDAQTLATRQDSVTSRNFIEKVRTFLGGTNNFLDIFQSDLPTILSEGDTEQVTTPTILPSKTFSPQPPSILLSILIAFSISTLMVEGQSPRIDVLDVKNIDASIYSKLPEDLNRPIEDLVRAITRDSYNKSQKDKDGYYSIGETSTRKEADDKANLLEKCIPSIDIKVKSESRNKHILYIKYLNDKSNIAWQVDYLSKHLGFSKENIIANIWKESVFDETAFSTAGAGGYLQVMAIAFREIQNRVGAIEDNEKNIKIYEDAIKRDTKKLEDASPAEKKRLKEALKLNETNRKYLEKEIDILYHYLYAVSPQDVRDKLKSYTDASHAILKESYFKDEIGVPASLRKDIHVQGKLSRYILWSMHIGDLNIPAGVAIKALYMNDIDKLIKQGQIPADTEPEMAADLMYNMGPGNFAILMKNRTSFADMIGSGLSPESRNYACKFLVMKLKIDPTYKIIKNDKDLDQKVKRYLITQVMFCDNSDVRLNSLKNRMRPLEKDAKNYSDMKGKKKKLQPFQQRTLDKYNQLKSEHDMIEKSLIAAKKDGEVDMTDRFGSDGKWDSPSSGKRKNFNWDKFSNEDVKQFFIDYLANDQNAAKLHGYMRQALYALAWNDGLANGNYLDLPNDNDIITKEDGNRTWVILTFGATAMLLLAGYTFSRKKGSAASDSKVNKNYQGARGPVARPGRISKEPKINSPRVGEKINDYWVIFNMGNNEIIPGDKGVKGVVLRPGDKVVWIKSSQNVLLERAHLVAA
jgi:hypothetical protein